MPGIRALALARWTGAGRELTTTGVLRPGVAMQACQALGIGSLSGKLRSAKDVPELDEAWVVALAADLVRVTANWVSAAPGVEDLARVTPPRRSCQRYQAALTSRPAISTPTQYQPSGNGNGPAGVPPPRYMAWVTVG